MLDILIYNKFLTQLTADILQMGARQARGHPNVQRSDLQVPVHW